MSLLLIYWEGGRITRPFIWESTRFCFSPNADRYTVARLMLSPGEVMVGFGIQQCLAVSDQRMT